MSSYYKVITPRMYRKGIPKTTHKLSNYIINTINEIIIETVDIALKSNKPNTIKVIFFINLFNKFNEYRIDKTIEDQSQKIFDSISV